MQRAIEEHTGRPLPPGWDASVQPRYLDAYAAELKPVPGVVDVLDRLDAAGVPTCVASSGTHEKMAFTLGLTGLAERFAGRIFSVDRGRARQARARPLPPRRGPDGRRSCRGVLWSRTRGPASTRRSRPGMRVLAYGGGVTPPARLARDGAEVFVHMGDAPPMLVPRR